MLHTRCLATLALVLLMSALLACEQRETEPAAPAPQLPPHINARPVDPEPTPAEAPTPAPPAEEEPAAPAVPASPNATENATPNTPAKEGDVVNRIETASGLIIEDLVIGTGPEAPPHSTVKIHYRGTLPDGKEFDSSYARNEPATFSLTQLIKGWQEGIPGMKVGGKRRLIVPPELGYGARGVPGVIPANSTLVFEIELLGLPR